MCKYLTYEKDRMWRAKGIQMDYCLGGWSDQVHLTEYLSRNSPCVFPRVKSPEIPEKLDVWCLGLGEVRIF